MDGFREQQTLFFAASIDIPEFAGDDWEITTEDNLWCPTLNAFVASWSGLSARRFLIFEFVQCSLAYVDFDFALSSLPDQLQLDLQCRPLNHSPFDNNWKAVSDLTPWFQDLHGTLYQFLFTDLLFVHAWSESIDGRTLSVRLGCRELRVSCDNAIYLCNFAGCYLFAVPWISRPGIPPLTSQKAVQVYCRKLFKWFNKQLNFGTSKLCPGTVFYNSNDHLGFRLVLDKGKHRNFFLGSRHSDGSNSLDLDDFFGDSRITEI